MRFRALFNASIPVFAVCLSVGQVPPAEQTYQRGAEALLPRAKALIHLDRYSEAEKLLRQYLDTHPESADAKFLLGYVLFRENQPEQSLAIYTAAAALQRPVPDDFKIVGLDYVLLNDYPDAIRWLEQSVKENPKDAEAVYYLGRAYYAQNWFEKAIAAFQRALELNPLFAKAQNNLGLAFAAQNKLDVAEQAYRRAIQLGEEGGKRSEQPYINLGELLIDHNRVREALVLLDAARQIDPKADRVEQLRGRALLSENRLEEAEAAFRAAIALKPDSGVLHYQLGRVLKRLGRAEEARQEFERSKALLGTHSALPY
ncbi:MAG: tetratricopeptide repeat protein [Bryobacteraceae bacterium]|jgi:tetratricopeptide (TPR) repeat protein